MERRTLGTTIADLRKANGMTQAELAEKMGITDKAVSKWERNLSCPDISSIPKLAEILGVSVDDLMQCKGFEKNEKDSMQELLPLILRAVAIAMSIAVIILSVIDKLDESSALLMLGTGLFCLSLLSFIRGSDK